MLAESDSVARQTVRRWQVVIGMVAAVLLVTTAGRAVTFNVTATVDGNSATIGSLTATVTPTGGAGSSRLEEATFQLGGGYTDLMCDGCDCQFRWFQIVTEDTDPINYLGNALNAPYVDPPKDGWDYQRTPVNDFTNGTPGADQAPFYENDDVAGTFAFPKYSGNFAVFGGNNNVPVHDDSTGVVRTQDVPGTTNGHSVGFNTFLVFINPELRADKQFIVVAGFAWSISRDGSGDYSHTGPTEMDMSDDGLAALFSNALGADGFGDWSALMRDEAELVCIPEPATLLLLGLFGGAGLMRRRAA